MSNNIRLDNIDHICLIVNDIEQTLDRINHTFETLEIERAEFPSVARLKGKDLDKYRVKAAMVRIANNMTIELLQIVEGKSIEQNWLKQHGETVHHIGIRVENLEEEVLKWEKKGIKVVQEDHGKWVYLDAENILGTMVELFNPKSLDVFV